VQIASLIIVILLVLGSALHLTTTAIIVFAARSGNIDAGKLLVYVVFDALLCWGVVLVYGVANRVAHLVAGARRTFVSPSPS